MAYAKTDQNSHHSFKIRREEIRRRRRLPLIRSTIFVLLILLSTIIPLVLVSWFINISAMEGSLWRLVEGGEHSGAILDGSSTSLPNFRSRSGGGILCAAIIHYNGNKCSVTMIVFIASSAPPRRLIKMPSVGITAVPWQIHYGVLVVVFW
jgi:hypothetical protein